MGLEVNLLCEFSDFSDVEVGQYRGSRTYAIKVRDMSPWAENFHKPEDALNALIAAREAGLKVPADITTMIAKKIVKSIFDTGDRL